MTDAIVGLLSWQGLQDVLKAAMVAGDTDLVGRCRAEVARRDWSPAAMDVSLRSHLTLAARRSQLAKPTTTTTAS